jgi:tRNA G37 N-methylase Trm5
MIVARIMNDSRLIYDAGKEGSNVINMFSGIIIFSSPGQEK